AIPTEETAAGLFYGGGFGLLVAQIVACLVALVSAGAVTLVISLVLRKTMGLRIDPRDELDGIDTIEHAERAYSFR
ncbi:ammonium transporter, partial [Mycobacterium tuberculosis]|nr:ammonium transporter [Mycobacterium tuberculosis]